MIKLIMGIGRVGKSSDYYIFLDEVQFLDEFLLNEDSLSF